MLVSKTYSVECPTYGLVNSSYWGRPLNGTGNFNERRRREELGGSRGMPPPPRKFLYLEALKRHFQHSQADGCVKKLPKIVYFFLTFTKRLFSSALFPKFIIIVAPLLMLAKYNTSSLRKTKKCTM